MTKERPVAILTIRKLVDDLDGSEADGTIEYTVGGRRYIIDLSKKNAEKFWADLDPWIKASRTVGAAQKAKKKSAPPPKIDPEQEKVIREWAKSKDQEDIRQLARSAGHPNVAERGRIALDTLIAAYNADNPTKRTAKRVSSGPAPTDVVDKADSNLFSAASA